MKANRQIQTTDSYLFVTSDEHVFFEREKAERHASKLTDKTIKTLTAQEAEKQTPGLSGRDERDDLDTFLDELTGN